MTSTISLDDVSIYAERLDATLHPHAFCSAPLAGPRATVSNLLLRNTKFPIGHNGLKQFALTPYQTAKSLPDRCQNGHKEAPKESSKMSKLPCRIRTIEGIGNKREEFTANWLLTLHIIHTTSLERRGCSHNANNHLDK
eukprot:scaffold4223_cov189-Amphora_coffeaeformis.AAC.10